MTSTADEIRNLRSGIENVIAACDSIGTDTNVGEAAAIIANQLRRVLKTPRASLVHDVQPSVADVIESLGDGSL